METSTPVCVPALIACAPEGLSARDLEDEITTLSASISIATWRLLMLIAELDRRGTWQQYGVLSCAHWLNWKCGIDMGAAREKVRVARALENLPLVSDALARGELSYSKARAITRVATPESEDYLLMIARHGTASHVEKLVRTYRRVDRLHEAARARSSHAQRALRWSYDDDGSMVITVRVPAEQGALVVQAIHAAVDSHAPSAMAPIANPLPRTFPRKRRACPSSNSFDNAESPVAARRADALCHVAEQFLAHEAVTSRQAERYQVVVHVDRADAGRRRHAECCHIEHGGAIAAETARRLVCDASVVTMEKARTRAARHRPSFAQHSARHPPCAGVP